MKLWLCLALLFVFSALVVSEETGAHGPHDGKPAGPSGHGQPVPSTPHPANPAGPPSDNTPGPERPPSPPSLPPYDPTFNPEVPTSSPTFPPDAPSLPPYDPTLIPSSSQDNSEDIVVCTMMMLQCPDGSYATQNSHCEYICGSAPIGGLSWSQVDRIRSQFASAYGSAVVSSTMVGTLNNKDVKIQSPPESFDDYCVEVVLVDSSSRVVMPSVYNGARVFYIDGIACSPINCGNGVLVGCNEVCPPVMVVDNSITLWPITIIFLVVLLSACCCCIRRRRNKTCKKAPSTDAVYPAQQYELVHQQEFVPTPENVAVAMYPPQHMMGPMMFPPMPPVPPHMMMPNGAPYPIMMQAPNGMWYPVLPQSQPEDA